MNFWKYGLSIFLCLTEVLSFCNDSSYVSQGVMLENINSVCEHTDEKIDEKTMEAAKIVLGGETISYEEIQNTKETLYDEELTNEYQEMSETELEETIYEGIMSESSISSDANISVKVLNEEEISNDDEFLIINSMDDLLEYVEAEDILINNQETLLQDGDDTSKNTATFMSSSQIKSEKTYCTKVLPLRNVTLRATINYNSSTGVIKSVTSRSLKVSGITAFQTIDNVTTDYWYSPTRKYVKITGEYDDVSRLITPWGPIEITRNSAFIQYKYNYKKGIYEEKGGFGYADGSF